MKRPDIGSCPARVTPVRAFRPFYTPHIRGKHVEHTIIYKYFIIYFECIFVFKIQKTMFYILFYIMFYMM